MLLRNQFHEKKGDAWASLISSKGCTSLMVGSFELLLANAQEKEKQKWKSSCLISIAYKPRGYRETNNYPKKHQATALCCKKPSKVLTLRQTACISRPQFMCKVALRRRMQKSKNLDTNCLTSTSCCTFKPYQISASQCLPRFVMFFGIAASNVFGM